MTLGEPTYSRFITQHTTQCSQTTHAGQVATVGSALPRHRLPNELAGELGHTCTFILPTSPLPGSRAF